MINPCGYIVCDKCGRHIGKAANIHSDAYKIILDHNANKQDLCEKCKPKRAKNKKREL